MIVEPLRQRAPQGRANVADRLVARHLVENDDAELGNALEKTAIAGCLQPGHHRSASIPMSRQQVFDQVVVAPGPEAIDDQMATRRRQERPGECLVLVRGLDPEASPRRGSRGDP